MRIEPLPPRPSPWFAWTGIAVSSLVIMGLSLALVFRTPGLTPTDQTAPLLLSLLLLPLAAGAGLAARRAGGFDAASGALGPIFMLFAVHLIWILFLIHYRDKSVALGLLTAAALLAWAGIVEAARLSRPAGWMIAPYLCAACVQVAMTLALAGFSRAALTAAAPAG